MIIVGHRGARGLAPENTALALKKGLQHRADQLEFDLRVTKDQVVILHHNARLSDASGQQYSIARHSYSQLKTHKADLTTLAEAMESGQAAEALYLEVKPREPLTPIIKQLQQALDQGWPAQHLLLASKSQKTLVVLHRALPRLPVIVIEPWSGVRAAWRARQLNTRLLSMNQLWLWSGFITAMSRRGWQLYAYTLNNPARARRWAKHGLYAAITDYPDRFEA